MGRRITGHNIICGAVFIEMMPTYFRKLEHECVFEQAFLLLSWILNFVACLLFLSVLFHWQSCAASFPPQSNNLLGFEEHAWDAKARTFLCKKSGAALRGNQKIIPSISAETLRRVLWKRGKRARRGLNRSHQADFSFTDHHIFLWNFQYCQVLCFFFVSHLSTASECALGCFLDARF